MRNDGKSLEQVVRLIEGLQLPEGFTIETRKSVFNDKGVKIAEFDILITGRIGSAIFTWLIECRDRPSEGPAGGEWIEQLAGRRDRFKFNKVMAVSTTGFSEGAKEEAARTGIDLRTVNELDYQEVMNWLPFNAPIVFRKKMLENVILILHPSTLAEDLSRVSTKLDATAEIVINKSSGKTLNMLSLWENATKKNEAELFKDVRINGKPKYVTITDTYDADQYEVMIGEHSVPLSGITFTGFLSEEAPEIPLAQILEYSLPAGNSIATIATWRTPEGKGVIKEMSFVGIRKVPSDSN